MKTAIRSRREMAEEFALALEIHRERMREYASMIHPEEKGRRRDGAGSTPRFTPARYMATGFIDSK